MNPTLLLLSFDHEERTGIAQALEGEGYSVATASSSANALEVAKNRRPDIGLVCLPIFDGDGATICEQLRTHHPEGEFPIIALINPGDDLEEMRLWAAGVIDCAARPITVESLFARLTIRLQTAAALKGKGAVMANNKPSVDPAHLKAMEKFAAHVAHDIKNPLSTLLGCVETLTDDTFPLSPDDQREMLTIVDESAARLNNIVDELSIVNTLRHGVDGGHEVDTSAALTGAVRRLRGMLRETQAELDLPSELLPQTRGNPLWVEEIFKSLLAKALLSTKEPPARLAVSVLEIADGKIALGFDYLGDEYPADFPDNRFDHPYSVNELRTKGRGLGLPTAAYMARELGGACWQEPLVEGAWRMGVILPLA